MWLDRYQALLCDLDGCLLAGDRVLPGALDLAAYAGDRLWIISNNSTDTPETLSTRLAGLGLQVPAARIVLAGATAIEQLASAGPGVRVCVYGSEAIETFARAAGLLLDAERPDVVLLTRDERFDYPQLNRAIRQIARGARLVVANRDAAHPGADGRPVAETGALLAALRACLPGLRYREIGKPSTAMYRAILARLGLEAASILAIGGNPATDGEGARRMGMDCAIVGPSHATHGQDLAALLVAEPRVRQSIRLPAP
ncbi:MAG: HAD-IIA family hydrolase [Reyranellaceae bacterium]